MANYNNSRSRGNTGDNGRNERVEYQIIEKLGSLVTFDNGWSREINIVAWNGGDPKFDIRDWDPDHRRMSKGIRLYADEAELLYLILADKFGPRDTRRAYSSGKASQGSGGFVPGSGRKAAAGDSAADDAYADDAYANDSDADGADAGADTDGADLLDADGGTPDGSAGAGVSAASADSGMQAPGQEYGDYAQPF